MRAAGRRGEEIAISNDGKAIAGTNYWDSARARSGKPWCSVWGPWPEQGVGDRKRIFLTITG